MNITKNNYEVYFIDYFDGNLSAELTAELFLFLESHPELKNEFESFELHTIENTNEIFPVKELLKKGTVNDANINWYLAARFEGDLNAEENNMLDEYLNSNPHHKKDATLFDKTKLEPGNEVFEDKKSLKQPVPFTFNITRTINYAIAAILLLSIIGGSYYMFIKTNQNVDQEFATIPQQAPVSDQPEKETDNKLQEDNPANFNNQLQTVNKFPDPKSESGSQPSSKRTKTDTVTPAETKTDIIPVKKIRPAHIDAPILAEVQPETKTEGNLQVMEVSPESELLAVQENDSEQYLSVWEAIRQGAKKNLNKLTESDGEVLASLDDNSKQSVRLFNIIGKGIEKVSNDKVNVDSNYDEEGKLSAFELKAGKFKIERKKGF